MRQPCFCSARISQRGQGLHGSREGAILRDQRADRATQPLSGALSPMRRRAPRAPFLERQAPHEVWALWLRAL
eukprot:15456839-Alexandrium_andersonii.AAC.1